MAPPLSPETRRKVFSVDEANRMLPLVRAIVVDITRQFGVVDAMRQRLGSFRAKNRRKVEGNDLYAEEMRHSQSELDTEETRLRGYIDELERLGVELKGPDGLCDFPSEYNGRPIYLCWHLGESEVRHWHDIHTGFSGRQPIDSLNAKRPTEHCSS